MTDAANTSSSAESTVSPASGPEMSRPAVSPIPLRVMSAAQVDRRRRREAMRVPAALRAQYTSANLTFRGMSIDLSLNGALILSPLYDTPGTAAVLTLETRGKEDLQLDARVARVNQGELPGMGLAFEGVADDTHDWLLDYCKKRGIS